MDTDSQNSLENWYWQISDSGTDEQRAAILSQIRAESPAVAAELEHMLEVADDARAFMNLPGDSAGLSSEPKKSETARPKYFETEITPESNVPISKTIGPYRLLEPIGEGGMGVVYLAQQSHPVRRRVALKIIKPELNSRQVIARFEAERQALAMMDHLNIASVLDAGTTDSGLPYFVMELVRGIPITDYCDQAKLNNGARLKLFIDTCLAIQHAHNKGIIHRDIKPSNVLVTEHDGTPVVKVIDFGVAKALTENLTDKTLFTGLYQMIGTPLYMSPEQASLSNLDVDTRSDVYSLGVLLYELISGGLPLDRESLNDLSFDELRKRIVDTEPPRPSKRLSALASDGETLAKCRGVGVNQLRRLIHDELDWVAMKAIEKDRTRRYQSPNELADDIQRHLDGDPVEACPPSWTYRTSKFFRRYQTAVLIASILILTLTMATVVSIGQAREATRASKNADRNLRLANAHAGQLAEYLYSFDMQSAAREHRRGNRERFQRLMERNATPERAHLKGFEWCFVSSLQPVPTSVLWEADDRLNDFVIADNGSFFASATSSGQIVVLDSTSGSELARLDTLVGRIHALKSISGNRILAVGDGGNLLTFLWDIEQQEVLRLDQLKIGDEPLLSIAIHPDEVIGWVGNNRGIVHQFDLTSRVAESVIRLSKERSVRDLQWVEGTLVTTHINALGGFTFEHSEATVGDTADWIIAANESMSSVRGIEATLDGSSVVFAQLKGLVTLIRREQQPVVEFSHLMPSDIHSVAISPDGAWIAAGDSRGRIHLVPAQDDRQHGFLDKASSRSRRTRSWQAHEGKIETIRFHRSPLGETQLISAGRDGRLVVSQPFHSRRSTFYPIERPQSSAAANDISSEILWGRLAMRADIRLGELERIKGPQGDSIGELQLSRSRRNEEPIAVIDRRILVSRDGGPDDSRRVIWTAPSTHRIDKLAEFSDANRFAVCLRENETFRHRIELYDTDFRRPVWSIESNLANDMLFVDSQRLLTYVLNNDIVVLDADTGIRRHLLQGHKDSILDLAIGPDGSELASVSGDQQLIVWDLKSGNPLWSQHAHENRAEAVCFHPVLSTIATVGADAIVRLWSNRQPVAEDSVRLVGEIPLDVGGCRGMTFSSDGAALFIYHRSRGVTELRGDPEVLQQLVSP